MRIESIVLVRHARSVANDDPSVYKRMLDHSIPLAHPDGDAATIRAGKAVAALRIEPSHLCAWCSSYLRCQQTEELVLETAFGERAEEIRRRPTFLLREQEFGDWDSLTEPEIAARDPDRYARRQFLADNYGRFYFRYPNGESRADVTQRLTLFIGKINRSHYPHHIVFLHGVTQRAFRMAWMNLTVDWFEEEPNPDNSSVLRIYRGRDGHWCEKFL